MLAGIADGAEHIYLACGYTDFRKQIEKLQSHVENLIQAILHSQKKMFGSSSEKTPVEGQISLFNEAEDSQCPYCAAYMVPIGKSVVRTELEFILASVKVIEYVQF